MQLIAPDVRQGHHGASCASGVETVILGPLDLLRWPTKCFSVYNMGALTLSGVRVEVSPNVNGYEQPVPLADPSDPVAAKPVGLWETYDGTTFTALPGGGVKSLNVSHDAHRWWRLVALNTKTPTISVSGYVHAQSL